MGRPGVILLVVLSAVLGGAAALGLGKAVGWVDDGESRTATVLVPTPDGGTPAVERVEGEAAQPLDGDGFDASEIYRKRASGVVTIFALFGGEGDAAMGAAAGFRVRGLGGRLRPHELARHHDSRRGPADGGTRGGGHHLRPVP